jgi:hypothetical protein
MRTKLKVLKPTSICIWNKEQKNQVLVPFCAKEEEFGIPFFVSDATKFYRHTKENTMLYHRLHPTQNKNTCLHDMFRFYIKSFSGAYHNKNFNNSVNAAYCVIACAL